VRSRSHLRALPFATLARAAAILLLISGQFLRSNLSAAAVSAALVARGFEGFLLRVAMSYFLARDDAGGRLPGRRLIWRKNRAGTWSRFAVRAVPRGEAPMRGRFDRWTVAWLVLSLVLALHVADEVLNGTLAFYRDLSDFIAEYLPFAKIPPFRPGLWLINLSGAALVLIALTWLVYKRRGPMRLASYVLATFATANAMLHIMMSLAVQHVMPGTLTSPLILAASLFLFVSIPADEDAGGPAPLAAS